MPNLLVPGRGDDPIFILTINGGSSSVKFAVFPAGDLSARAFAGKIERIGSDDASMTTRRGSDVSKVQRKVDARSVSAAGDLLMRWLDGEGVLPRLCAVGHRVVHGGEHHVEPERVSPALLDDLRSISVFDPDHLPGEIALIEEFGKNNRELPQFACFDTSFHHDMPGLARLLPIPRRYERKGVRRYGFHGLSYEYLLDTLREQGRAAGRVILAHLGSGASLAAVKWGKCVDTTMAFTPTAGLMMGTRSGDLDPGLVGYFARAEGMTAEQFHAMVNTESGLLGVSETSADVRDLEAARLSDPRASDALDLFGYQLVKWIGAFAAILGGLDTLVFSAGIGEHSPEVRARACAGLSELLGIEIDYESNRGNAARISTDTSRVTVLVVPTDEELTIARSVARLLGASSS
jgi:acetate kinase